MKRLNLYLDMFNENFLEDCLYLKANIPQLEEVDNALIQMLYTTWCDDFWCTTWFKPNMDTVEEFSAWLCEELKDELSH